MMDVIIIGANHNNTLGLVRSLGEKGHSVNVLLYKSTINFVFYSKYVFKCQYINTKEPLFKQIIEFAKMMTSKPLLFCTSDESAEYVCEHAEQLKPYCFFEYGEKANLYRNKNEEITLAHRCGFEVPQNRVVESPTDSIDEIDFPVLLKANNSIRGGKSALQRIDNAQQLKDVLNRISSDSFPLQIQKYIEKDFELMLIGCSLHNGEIVYTPVAQRKIRFFPNEYNAGSFSYSIDPRTDTNMMELQKKVAKYINMIGYTGLFSAEFVCKNGTYFFLEINLRNDGTSYLATKSGYNLPHLLCNYFESGNDSIEGDFSTQYYMVNVSDFGNVIRKKISFYRWLKDVKKATCFSHFNSHDVLPYLGFILSFAIDKIMK